ncbi:hypothetical protein [Photorhabdus heterorhabditis]|nr:hypothetical protein [Photorhabdus heterorhabditis]
MLKQLIENRLVISLFIVGIHYISFLSDSSEAACKRSHYYLFFVVAGERC